MAERSRREYVVIGPVGAGKTTVSSRLAKRLAVPHLELDSIAREYYLAAPEFDQPTFNQLMDESALAAFRYWAPAQAFAVECVVRDHHDCVFDVGAGHTSFDDHQLYERVAKALGPFSNIVLLLPSHDAARSVEVCRDRVLRQRGRGRGHEWVHEGVDFIERWVTSEHNRALANRIIFTDDRDPDALVDEILEPSA